MEDEAKSGTSRVVSETAPSAQNSQVVYSQSPGQSQTQVKGQGQGQKLYNPCKCCCGGNLRQACFAIFIVELVFCILIVLGFVVDIIRDALGGPNETKYRMPFDPHTLDEMLLSYVFGGLMLFWLFIATVSLFMAVFKRKKSGCILHTVFAGLLAALNFAEVIISAYYIDRTDVRDDEIRDETGLRRSRSTLKLGFQIAESLITMFVAIYFSVVSFGLFTQYRAGNTYEGAPLCCCGGGYQGQGQGQGQPPPAYRSQ